MANIINRFGDSIDTIAFSWLVYQFTGKGSWAAIVFAVNKIPSVVFLPLAGAFVEKKVKKNIMMICDMIRALLVTILLICIMTQRLSLVILLLFSFLISLAEAFRIPAGVSFISQLLEKEELSYGVSLNVLASMLAGVVGTGIGGFIISWINLNTAFIIDIATFVLSIALISVIFHSELISHELINQNSITIFKEGLGYVRKRKILVYVILSAVFANALMAPIDSLQTPIVVTIFKQNATYLSLLNVCLTIGILLGSAVYPVIQNKIKTTVLFLFSFSFIAFLYLLIAFMDYKRIAAVGIWYYGIIACYLIYGLIAGFLTSGLGIILMKYTDQNYMSRVNTIFTAIGEAVVPVTSSMAGVLLGYFKIHIIFRVIAIGTCIFIFGAAIFHKKIAIRSRRK